MSAPPWDDLATVYVWPAQPTQPSPATLASCVRFALELAAGDTLRPGSIIELHHHHVSEGHDVIHNLEEIRELAADPTFPRAVQG